MSDENPILVAAHLVCLWPMFVRILKEIADRERAQAQLIRDEDAGAQLKLESERLLVQARAELEKIGPSATLARIRLSGGCVQYCGVNFPSASEAAVELLKLIMTVGLDDADWRRRHTGWLALLRTRHISLVADVKQEQAILSTMEDAGWRPDRFLLVEAEAFLPPFLDDDDLLLTEDPIAPPIVPNPRKTAHAVPSNEASVPAEMQVITHPTPGHLEMIEVEHRIILVVGEKPGLTSKEIARSKGENGLRKAPYGQEHIRRFCVKLKKKGILINKRPGYHLTLKGQQIRGIIPPLW